MHKGTGLWRQGHEHCHKQATTNLHSWFGFHMTCHCSRSKRRITQEEILTFPKETACSLIIFKVPCIELCTLVICLCPWTNRKSRDKAKAKKRFRHACCIFHSKAELKFNATALTIVSWRKLFSLLVQETVWDAPICTHAPGFKLWLCSRLQPPLGGRAWRIWIEFPDPGSDLAQP